MLIDSLSNTQVKYWTSLNQTKNRVTYGQFLVEGDHLVQEAASVGAIDAILLRLDRVNPYPELKTILLSDKVFNKVSNLELQGSIMALCHLPKSNNELGQRILMCDRIQDPGNLGTMIRTATAFGFDRVVCSEDCVDFTNEKVIRATQGAIFHIDLETSNLIETIKRYQEAAIKIIGATLDKAVTLSNVEPTFPVALVLGNEGGGVATEVLALCDLNVVIESKSFESLNVAIAAGILCHHFRK